MFGFKHLDIPLKILIDHSYLYLPVSFKVSLFPIGVIAFSEFSGKKLKGIPAISCVRDHGVTTQPERHN